MVVFTIEEVVIIVQTKNVELVTIVVSISVLEDVDVEMRELEGIFLTLRIGTVDGLSAGVGFLEDVLVKEVPSNHLFSSMHLFKR